MPLKKDSEPSEFLGEIPTQQQDIAALQAMREIATGLDWWIEMQILHDALPEASKKAPRGTCEGFEPFEL